MTGSPDPFATSNPDRVEMLSIQIGGIFANAVSVISEPLIQNPAITPHTLAAAIARAHAAGLAAAIATAAGGDLDQLLDDVTTWLRVQIVGARSPR